MENQKEIVESVEPIKREIEENRLETFDDVQKEAEQKFSQVETRLLANIKTQKDSDVLGQELIQHLKPMKEKTLEDLRDLFEKTKNDREKNSKNHAKSLSEALTGARKT